MTTTSELMDGAGTQRARRARKQGPGDQDHQYPWDPGCRHLGLQRRGPARIPVGRAYASHHRHHIPAQGPSSAIPIGRRSILFFEEDTSPGIHDTLLAACDDYRYGLLGCTEYHDNCTDNLIASMRQIGLTPPEVPSPVNLWMNIPVDKAGNTTFAEPALENRATMSCYAPRWIALSRCLPARRTSCRSTAPSA